MNPLRIITLALKQAGVLSVGQTPDAEDTNDCFTMLNTMVALWNRKRWLVYNLVDVSKRMTGAQSYTVGPGGDFNVARPDSIERAYVRLLTSNLTLDRPLDILEAQEDYTTIALKSLVSFPKYIFYNSDYPTGKLYVWPVPNNNYEVHILVKQTLSQFADLVTDINLPPEYQEALIWNLAARIRPMYGLQPDPTITVFAKTALSTLRGANSQIPELQLPQGLTRGGGLGSGLSGMAYGGISSGGGGSSVGDSATAYATVSPPSSAGSSAYTQILATQSNILCIQLSATSGVTQDYTLELFDGNPASNLLLYQATGITNGSYVDNAPFYLHTPTSGVINVKVTNISGAPTVVNVAMKYLNV